MKYLTKISAKQVFTYLPGIRHLLLGLVLLNANNIVADTSASNSSLVPPSDPTQSITFWKKYALENDDELVQLSQQVFTVLLRAWDQSRIEPGLYVVESDSGSWAASLADGNILLSRQAIETCFSFGRQRGEHLLAFVLAHELAHQRADDLWHQRFFRMIGTQSIEAQKKMMAGLELDAELLSQLEQKEAQADHDGLVLMSSVGFDAYQIINEKDFFTLWVENIWQQNCADNRPDKQHYNACKQAQARALRTQTQLETVATQSMLYELGVQAFVAGNYPQAREYFTIYGRDYPGRAIISAIGLSYFAQAQAVHSQINELRSSIGKKQQADFYYPMILDAHAGDIATAPSASGKRGDIKNRLAELQKQKSFFVSQSIRQFEKAIRLAPDYQQTYLLLASAHLLANNSYRVRGVLQGQYVPRFGSDGAVEMLLALTAQVEGDTEQSIRQLQKLVDALKRNRTESPLAENILRYSVYYNLAEIYMAAKKTTEAKKVWLDLAQLSRKKGDALLFRLALSHINDNHVPISTKKLQQAPSINGNHLGGRLRTSSAQVKSDLWIDGDRYQVTVDKDARYITQENGTLISVWRLDSAAAPETVKATGKETGKKTSTPDFENKLNIGDPAERPFKTLGIPDRRLNMTSGEYLAYDEYGLAIRISNNQVKGWFLYDN